MFAYIFKYQDVAHTGRAKEWLILWSNGDLSFYREASSRRMYLESAGWWYMTGAQVLYLRNWACSPLHQIPRHQQTILRQRGAVWPLTSVWDSRPAHCSILFQAVVFCSHIDLEYALRRMYVRAAIA